MRTAGNTNPPGTYHYKRTGLKRLSVFIQHSVELFDFGLQGSAWKAKEDEPSMDQLEHSCKKLQASVKACPEITQFAVFVHIINPTGFFVYDFGP